MKTVTSFLVGSQFIRYEIILVDKARLVAVSVLFNLPSIVITKILESFNFENKDAFQFSAGILLVKLHVPYLHNRKSSQH